MNTEGLTKINHLLQQQPPGALFFSSWMYENGVSYELQRRYRDTKWLKSIAPGVMIRTGEKPTLYSAISCLNRQTNKHFHIGAWSALELAGYAHYIPMGRQRIVVYAPRGEWFPAWLEKHDFGMDILKITSENTCNHNSITTIMQGGFEIPLSSPEKAFIEGLSLVPKYYNLTDLYYVMEQLTTLRPEVVQTLLSQECSVKVKRLFLYMAEKANHTWFEAIDISKIHLGSGKRAIVKNGVYIPKYQIVVSEDLKNYE
jgi:hypothetical protein